MHFRCRHPLPLLTQPFLAQTLALLAMAASHSDMFKPSSVDEGELAKDEDIPTPKTNKIVVLTSFFHRIFGLPTCKFLCGLLLYYKIELVHLNLNSILQIAAFVHLCETYLAVHPNFPLFKHYFFLKYQLISLCTPTSPRSNISS
jgi:hypothetical protein